jgi:hypothetical protein
MSKQNHLPATEQEIVELERQWMTASQNQDTSQMNPFLSETYFLAKATSDQSFCVLLKRKTESPCLFTLCLLIFF